ncbi:MAG: DUF2806 domain-containing protein [Oscillospiraceae bacterium]|nr:DUF2806 domain-containing protein [Oscillospiraceae bacterium]
MTGNELIALISENFNTLISAIGPIAGAVFTAIFLRHNIATEEFEKVKAGKLGEVAEDLLKSGKMTYTEYYKANNFLRIVEKADKEYSKNPHVEGEKTYNFDWFVRFYEAVGNISNEQMQSIWARILAGEINKPNTYSLRTIEVLKNLSQQEAELFAKICSHCICTGQQSFLPHYDKYLEACQITFGEILYLSELGLISSDSMLVLKMPIDMTPRILFVNRELLITASATDENNKMFEVRQFPLTGVGIELSTLVAESTTDDDFITFAEEINTNPSTNVALHRIVSIEGDEIKYNNTNLLNEEV